MFTINGDSIIAHFLSRLCCINATELLVLLDIRSGQAVSSQGEGEFASMMQVMFDDMPNHPLTSQLIRLPLVLALKDICHIFWRPTLQTLLPGAKRHFQAAHQFCCGWYLAIVLPLDNSGHIGITLAHEAMQPGGSRAYNMFGEQTNRTQIGSYAEFQLLRGERPDCLYKMVLIDIPALIIVPG